MTAVREKTATDVVRTADTNSAFSSDLPKYVGVGLLAIALGVGAVVARGQLATPQTVSTPAEVASVRAQAYVDQLEYQWAARIQRINDRRAQDMVERYSSAPASIPADAANPTLTGRISSNAGLETPSLAAAQRAADMVEHKWGLAMSAP